METKTPFDSIPEISFPELSDDKKEELFELSKIIFGELLYCDRVWSAWGYGTMSADDFSLAADDDALIEEAAEHIFEFIQNKKI